MKRLTLTRFIIFSLLLYCSAIKAQYKSFNDYFFNNYVTYYSLGNFMENNNIIVVDESEKISKYDLNYHHEENGLVKNIQIVHRIPKEKKYLFLSDYIVNENLAIVSFSLSDHKKYIIFTLKRKDSKTNWWETISIYNGSMN